MKQQGFTLIEVLTYTGVLVLVLGSIFFFIANIVTNERTIGERVRMIDEADFAMRQILDHTRGARNIDVSTVFNSGGNGSQLALTKTSSSVTIYVDSTSQALVITDTAAPGYTRRLTSPRVAVDTFALICVGDPATSCASPTTVNPVGVQIKLGLRDVTTNQTISVVTSATPRGY